MKTSQTQMHFSWHEALAADVAALGGRKKLAPQLWPSEDEETAQNRLKAALSPGHAQELKPPEVLKIKQLAHDVGSDALISYEAQLLGYTVTWVEPEDELQRIERENNELLKALTKRLERADTLRSQLKAVEGGRR